MKPVDIMNRRYESVRSYGYNEDDGRFRRSKERKELEEVGYTSYVTESQLQWMELRALQILVRAGYRNPAFCRNLRRFLK